MMFCHRRYPLQLISFQILAVLFTQQLFAVDGALVTSIDWQDEDCFVTKAKGTSTLYGNWELLTDDVSPQFLSVIVMQTDNDRILYRSPRNTKTNGVFEVKLADGQRVATCIQNGLRPQRTNEPPIPEAEAVQRRVGFSLDLQARSETLELLTQQEKLTGNAQILQRNLYSLVTHHEYMKSREAQHRELVELTFSQLLNWTLLEACMVMVLAISQVVYLQRFIEKRRYI